MAQVSEFPGRSEAQWLAQRRAQVAEYLRTTATAHGAIGEVPAWHVSPYASLWAVESLKAPGYVGWWVFCGDGPTDYISSKDCHHPREALRSFASRWVELAPFIEKGQPHPDYSIGAGGADPVLADLLKRRARFFLEVADDNELWEPDAR